MSIKSDCEIIIEKIKSMNKYVDSINDDLGKVKSNAESGMVVGGKVVGSDEIDLIKQNLSSLKNSLRMLKVECFEIIAAEEAKANKKNTSSSNKSSSGDSEVSSTEKLLRGGLASNTVNTKV